MEIFTLIAEWTGWPIVATLMFAGGGYGYWILNQQIELLKITNEKLANETPTAIMRRATEKLDFAEKDFQELTNEIHNLSQQLEESSSQIEEKQLEIEAKQKELEQKEDNIKSLKADLKNANEIVRKRLRDTSGGKKEKPSREDKAKAIAKNQELLAAELTFIGQTAFQTNEDRQRVAQFYFISFGSFFTAIISILLLNLRQSELYALFGFVFLLVAFLGNSTIFQLTRLRQAWLESVVAMNRLKAFIQEANSPALDQAFYWLYAPAAYKRGSVSYYQAIQVAVVAGIALGLAGIFFFVALGLLVEFWQAILFGGVISIASSGYLFIARYKRPLVSDIFYENE